MRTRLALAVGMLLAAVCYAEEEAKEYRYKMSLDDTFVVKTPEGWTAKEEKYLPLRFANVEIAPKKGGAFSLMLYFKCDTPDLAQFDSMEKIERSLRASSEKYLAGAVEKTLTIKKIGEGRGARGVARSGDRATTGSGDRATTGSGDRATTGEGEKVGYGCYAVLTDAEVAKKQTSEIAEGEFKYIVRGMIRLSPDSALGFSLMVNDLDSPGYREVMDYIQSFVKKA
jgi:hypothetical protein